MNKAIHPIAKTLSNHLLFKTLIMKTIEKIEKKGYKVTANIGYKYGNQCIVSYSAKRIDGRMKHEVTQPNITQLWKATYNKTY